jgi:hypothetical protein
VLLVDPDPHGDEALVAVGAARGAEADAVLLHGHPRHAVIEVVVQADQLGTVGGVERAGLGGVVALGGEEGVVDRRGRRRRREPHQQGSQGEDGRASHASQLRR